MKTALTLALCILAAPAFADACADFKAALAVLTATLQAAESFENSNLKPPDDSPEAQEWLSSKMAYFAAMDRAFEEVREARQAVDESIQDEDAVRAINHIVSIFGPSLEADASRRWHLKEGLFSSSTIFCSCRRSAYVCRGSCETGSPRSVEGSLCSRACPIRLVSSFPDDGQHVGGVPVQMVKRLPC